MRNQSSLIKIFRAYKVGLPLRIDHDGLRDAPCELRPLIRAARRNEQIDPEEAGAVHEVARGPTQRIILKRRGQRNRIA
ncbi:MAG: hypothetical protein HGA45_27065 [Chloroflexales bacterium]|nr:hypothetical protein [Chloroflexales bacterium]